MPWETGHASMRPEGPRESSPTLSRPYRARCRADGCSQGIAALSPGLGSAGPLGRTYRLSVYFNGDDMRLDLAVDSAPPEPLGDCLLRDVGCFAKPRGIAGLDLISQRCALTVRNRWDPGGCRST